MVFFLTFHSKLTILTFIFIFFISFSHGHGISSKKVLLISFDGFRHDYFEMAEKKGFHLENFRRIFLQGTKAHHINNLFLTRTFPNHMSIITGCYEESHGIVDNTFFDPLFNESFNMRNTTQSLQSKWFSSVEPIWVTNQKNGHKSALIYWPGQLAPFRDLFRPSYSFGVFNKDININYKFDVMLDWLKDEHTTLGIIYHPQPDIEGHKHGPNSSSVAHEVSLIDKSLGYLLKKINESNLRDSLNVVVVSDHGMSEISPTKRIIMDKYLSSDLYFDNLEQSFSLWGIWPLPHVSVNTIFSILQTVPHTTTYLKEEIPLEWHYRNNRRIAPIIVIADEGWILVHRENDTVTNVGTHGFKISEDSMKGIFFAWGPNIAINNRSDSVVREIDVFPLIAEILKLDYIPQINGSLSRVRWILQSGFTDMNVLSSFIMVCVLALLCVLAICIVISCAHHHAKSVHLQRSSQTYALQTGKLVRVRQTGSNRRDNTGWGYLSKSHNKKPKMAAADTAFLLESSSGNDDEILGDVTNSSVHKST